MTLKMIGATHMHAMHVSCDRWCVINYEDTKTGKVTRHKPIVPCSHCRGTGTVKNKKPS